MKNIKPSELIKLALHDLEVVENNRQYKVSMDHWHFYNGEKCCVCLAGAFMAVTMKFPVERRIADPGSCWPEAHPYLLALNRFRLGHVLLGLQEMGITNQHVEPFFEVRSYQYDPYGFKEDMLRMAEYLETKGL
jgi:hypothetical protein